MVWGTSENKADIQAFLDVLQHTSMRGIVVFCMSWDGEGADSQEAVYPAGFSLRGLYRVAAVYGDGWPSAEARRKRAIDLVLPGRELGIAETPRTATTAEATQASEVREAPSYSIAPALAARLASLAIYCTNEIMPLSGTRTKAGKYDIVEASVSYVKRRQDTEQNLSRNSG